MSLDLVVALWALAFPGSFTIAAWDYTAHRRDRPTWHTIALGVPLSLLIYAFLQLCGVLDLPGLVVTGSDGNERLSLVDLLATPNLGVFLGVTWFGGVAGLGLGRAAHSQRGDVVAQSLLGKSIGGSSWATAITPGVGQWVHVRTRNGRDWTGILSQAAEHPREGFVVLRQPDLWDPESSEWMQYNFDRVILAIADIEHLGYAPTEDAAASIDGVVADPREDGDVDTEEAHRGVVGQARRESPGGPDQQPSA